MNIQAVLENVDEGGVFVSICLSSWIVLLSVRFDQLLVIPFWAVFCPLWLWKGMVILGCIIGVLVWLKGNRVSRSATQSSLFDYGNEDTALPYIHAMLVTTFFHLLLAVSEVLLCIRLSQEQPSFSYLVAFSPLLLVGLLGTFAFLFLLIETGRPVSMWRRRRRRNRPCHSLSRQAGRNPVIGTDLPQDSAYAQVTIPAAAAYDESSLTLIRPRRVCSFQLELAVAANLLQILFVVARLDKWVNSSWIVILIPSFVLISVLLLVSIAGLIVALITFCNGVLFPFEQRRLSVYFYTTQTLIFFLLLSFILLLSLRLDSSTLPMAANYSLVCFPLLISVGLYLFKCFQAGPGNPWWFGLGSNVTVAILESCPALQLCANTRVTAHDMFKNSSVLQSSGVTTSTTSSQGLPAPVDVIMVPPAGAPPQLNGDIAASVGITLLPVEDNESTSSPSNIMQASRRTPQSTLAVTSTDGGAPQRIMPQTLRTHPPSTSEEMQLHEDVHIPD